MSRDPGLFNDATRVVAEMLAGVSGVELMSDVEEDFSNSMFTNVRTQYIKT